MNARIRFGRSVNVGNFSNFKMEVERDVADGEVLEGALLGLQNVVDVFCAQRYQAVTGGLPPHDLAHPVQREAAESDGYPYAAADD